MQTGGFMPSSGIQSARYSRQTRFVGLGQTGQERLAQARVAIVGLGATGSTIAHGLLRAGIGYLRLIDRDWVETHNLPRQSFYTEADAEQLQPKVVAAKAHGQQINSACEIDAFVLDLHAGTIDQALAGVDLVMDGTDSLETRLLINEWCVREQVPWIYSGVLGGHGMSANFRPQQACWRCLFATSPEPGSMPTCETAGVVGPVVGVIGNLAATEALKLLSGQGQANPDLFMLDLWAWQFEHLPMPAPRPDCPVCGLRQFDLLDHASEPTVSLCGRDAIQIRPQQPTTIGLARLAHHLHQADVRVVQTDYLLRFAADSLQATVFPDGRVIVSGTDDPAVARGFYNRWINH
ncbi:ThiF family adenylyltransferase [Herpetosiphon sp. NSE202]|uniref:ThiF family adenylyltransferase n=1 Tax=Herpetosiphon sp. NSE202 TaxID=3351349 RepID=UPI0036415883